MQVTLAPPREGSRRIEVISVVGHTAHIYNNTMFVIFGHSPDYGYMNTVQECNLCKFLHFTYIVLMAIPFNIRGTWSGQFLHTI